MSDDIKDGGPAFPVYYGESPGAPVSDRGMKLRDWFAGQALANPGICNTIMCSDNSVHVRRAYAIADMMLKERGQK